ncbi:uracil-DNA glycosylase [Gonapodya prolifera JEL478]|uniref:Uracil-DNA glycosylase n=1 Tax=Gonapodya prolifera (strain JEL478) TaxID=1344416 RepID=A0A139AAH2_GONPJ|nr:uracil-DNA glycosylase [Gonapodya prolifera JEL478]|eukprot:KXS13698.1 uracil-DNA glycosylase [Gonapodya prolifera JEL478]
MENGNKKRSREADGTNDAESGKEVDESESAKRARKDGESEGGEKTAVEKSSESTERKPESGSTGEKADEDPEFPEDDEIAKIARREDKLKTELGGELMALLTLEINTMGADWFDALVSEMKKPYFKQIKSFLAKEYAAKATVYPPERSMYSWSAYPLKQVKVVILGQDPYHGPNQAHGLCFSVQKGVTPPPSLVNIYKELESDLGTDTGEGKSGFKKPKHGYLDGWAKQGVLLLNTTLTVRAAHPNSHSACGWETFTDAVIRTVDRKSEGVVFILWGGNAQKKGGMIDKKKHLVLKSAHPSPLSAHRGFFGCKHFSSANKFLKERGRAPIDWNDLP